jgi:hypothetical protein
MLVAVLIACLVAEPGECETYEMPLVEVMPHMQMVEAQTWAVSWLKAHPGMRMESLKVLRGRSA